jgi:hypothetical protein
MAFGKIFGVLIVLSLAATGTTMARDISSGTAGEKGKTANLVKGDKGDEGDKGDKGDKGNKGNKGNKVGAKSEQVPVSVRHAKPQAPIVMGRSVSVHYKTKLHHVKMKPLDSVDTPVAADGFH